MVTKVDKEMVKGLGVLASKDTIQADDIDNETITLDKLQNVNVNSVLARTSGGSGPIQTLTVGLNRLVGRGSTGVVAAIALDASLFFSGATLGVTGAVNIPATDPNGLGSTNVQGQLDALATRGAKAVGEIFFHTGVTPPVGAIAWPHAGGPITSALPQLRQHLIDNGYPLDGSGDPLLPPADNRFLRAAGGTYNVGDIHADQMQRITGVTGRYLIGAPDNVPASGAFSTQGAFNNQNGLATGTWPMRQDNFDSANSPGARTGDVTHPKGLVGLLCIQAFGAVVDDGTVVISELANDVVDLESRTSVIEGQQYGINQTLKAVTRSVGTAYRNNSEKAITAYVRLGNTGGNSLQASSDGITWINIAGSSGAVSMNTTVEVPPGWYYRVSGGVTENWSELS